MLKKIFKNNETNDTTDQIEKDIPRHIAIIMDGNGRWAKKKFLPRIAGHKEGMATVKTITRHASKLGVKVLTLYAFSTENWKRPDEEVNFLMKLPVDFFAQFVPELIQQNVKVTVMGHLEKLPPHTQKAVQDAIEQTRNNTGMILNFALNYGSRSEIVHAVKEIVATNIPLEEITEDTISEHLMTAMLPKACQDPELLIRTSGEVRVSNFLLWQIAYSECYFTDELWPDFNEKSLEKAINSYQNRERRFGGIKEPNKTKANEVEKQ